MSNFLTREDHSERLLGRLTGLDRDLYDALRHNRVEPSFVGRTFVVYKMAGSQPQAIDNIEVMDFVCDDASGVSVTVKSAKLGTRTLLGYVPTRLFGYPIFAWMPLTTRARWCATPEMAAAGGGSLGFDIVLRTESFNGPREEGVVHIVTGPKWVEEFGPLAKG